MSWSLKFDDPVALPDGRRLKTLAEAMAWLAKEIPKSENKMEKVQTAAHLVTRAAEARRADDDLRADGNDAGGSSPSQAGV